MAFKQIMSTFSDLIFFICLTIPTVILNMLNKELPVYIKFILVSDYNNHAICNKHGLDKAKDIDFVNINIYLTKIKVRRLWN